MAPPVRLRAQLPDDRHNGLFAPDKVNDFLAQPRTAVLVVGVLFAPSTDVNNETGVSEPVLRFKHIEVISPGHDHYGMAAEIMHQAHQVRTGEMMLPFQPGEDIPVPHDGEPETGDSQ